MSRQIRVSILGATGSVGRATRKVISGDAKDGPDFKVVALTANSNVQELAAAAVEHSAEFAAIAKADLYQDLKSALSHSSIEVGAGPTAICEAAARQADTVVAAIVGIAGLEPTLTALGGGAAIALANKESMVCAGPLINSLARKANCKILPIDSEHNAIFQVLDHPERVESITLTASGGPFRTATLEEMRTVSRDAALRHPKWKMGAKISIDSATMMNKGLELIEAVYLFDLKPGQVDVVVHPQSIVHSLVNYDDGSVLAQMGNPDMCIPISYALAWPGRMALPGIERLDLAKIGRLDFEAPDFVRFPALNLAKQAIRTEGVAPIVLNAANEIAVEAFLQEQIGFLDIAETVEHMLSGLDMKNAGQAPMRLEDILEVDDEVRRRTLERLELSMTPTH